MIGKLRGTIDSTTEDAVILDVGGVGYVVYCSAHTLRKLPGKGEMVNLLIDTRITEDRFDLLGFLDETERGWYRELVKVSGVSVRIALSVLSVLSPSQLANAIMAQDAKAFKQANGVGPKLATRIVTEMKDKVPSLATGQVQLPETKAANNSSLSDAVSALVNLGYNRTDAFSAVTQSAQENAAASVSELIRLGLKRLSKDVA